jgi:hypothetical protein
MKQVVEYTDYKTLENFIYDRKAGGLIPNVNPAFFFDPFKYSSGFDYSIFRKKFLAGRAIQLPYFEYIDPIMKTYPRFEEFTGVDEVNNLSSWLVGFLDFSEEGIRIGKELQVIQQQSPRDGRLDASCYSLIRKDLLVFEAKKSLPSLIAEKRFEYQIPEYQKELDRLMRESDICQNTLLLAVGGEETDLYPEDHIDCTTGKVGNLAKTFYTKSIESKIRFVSANALWGLNVVKIAEPDFNPVEFLIKLFEDEAVHGLVSGGAIYNTPQVELLPLVLR